MLVELTEAHRSRPTDNEVAHQKLPEREGDQWQVLSGLRFLLATCVVITHSGIVAPDSFVFRYLGGQTGYAAVFCFFMISGYSIAASITARRNGYFLRRIRRIYPTLLVTIVICLILGRVGPLVLPEGQVIPAAPFWTVVGNLFLVQSILVKALPQDGALWSLSIEWWLYMLAPLLIRIRNSWVITLGAFSFIALCVWGNHHPVPPSDQSHVNLLIISWPWVFGFAYFRKRTPFTFLLLLGPPLLMFDIYIRQTGSALIIALTAIAIAYGRDIRISSPRVKDCLNWLGNASYPLYLLHAPLLFATAAFTPLRNGNLMVPLIITTILATYFITSLAWGRLAKWLAGSTLGRLENKYRLRAPKTKPELTN